MPNAKVLESKKAIVDELTGKIQGRQRRGLCGL